MIIDALWSKQDGAFFCIATKTGTGMWEEHFFRRREIGQLRKFLKEHDDKDIYFCPHGFKSDRRLKKNAVMPKMLWADLDEADPRDCKIKPTIAFESSPGRFVGLWLTDKPVTEDLNRRLTYYEDADKGGWDLTQVLRVPGTINYKYNSLPKVKLLWDDGPVYKIRDLERMIPQDEKGRDLGELSVSDIYRDYEKKLPPWARRELLRESPPPAGKRSEMLYKLEHAMLSAGMTQDEAFVTIKASVWNKFAGRRSEDEQLMRELDKVYSSRLKDGAIALGAQDDLPEGRVFLARPLSEVEEEDIDWIWFPYLARGEVTILEGDPGLGKSYLAQMIAKHICDGETLPSIDPIKLPPGPVAYFDIENNVASVTKKRMRWNGLKNDHLFFPENELFSLDEEDVLDDVYEAFDKLRPILGVFDTVNNYMGSVDTHKASEVAQSLAFFTNIARRFNTSVLLLRHMTKGTKDKAVYRGQGSIAFTGVARLVISCGVLPDDPEQRAFVVTKTNNGPVGKAMTYDIDGQMTRNGKSRFRFGDYVDYDAEDIINTKAKSSGGAGSERKVRDDAKEWLEALLGEKPRESTEVYEKGEAKGFTTRTLQRAAEELEVKKTRVPGKRGSAKLWRL